jgi:pimeloyl-ACP methyl ester carboxylesterase
VGHGSRDKWRPRSVSGGGARADASSWNGVISQLQLLGFTVYAPPNPLRGLPEDSDYLHQFLTQNPALQGQPVILVAHSYGGAVITSAAVGDPEVKALVYVDAFIPDEGDTVASLLSGSCLAGNPADLFNIVPIPGAPMRRRNGGAIPGRDSGQSQRNRRHHGDRPPAASGGRWPAGHGFNRGGRPRTGHPRCGGPELSCAAGRHASVEVPSADPRPDLTVCCLASDG